MHNEVETATAGELRRLLMRFEREQADLKADLRRSPSGEKSRELRHQLDLVKQRINTTKTQLQIWEVREAFQKLNRRDTAWAIGRYVLFAIGVVSLALMAYLFRSSPLAAIPLVGMVVLVVLWPAFEKFRSLARITAEFHPGRVNLAIAATETSEYIRLQNEIEVKKLLAESTRLDRQIEASSPNATSPGRESQDDELKPAVRIESRASIQSAGHSPPTELDNLFGKSNLLPSKRKNSKAPEL